MKKLSIFDRKFLASCNVRVEGGAAERCHFSAVLRNLHGAHARGVPKRE
jgi:hypothetical protein